VGDKDQLGSPVHRPAMLAPGHALSDGSAGRFLLADAACGGAITKLCSLVLGKPTRDRHGETASKRSQWTLSDSQTRVRAAAQMAHPHSIEAMRSPIMTAGKLVLARMISGIKDASAITKWSVPRTRPVGSHTLDSSVPIAQVPTGW
jgi:hypothetical protein